MHCMQPFWLLFDVTPCRHLYAEIQLAVYEYSGVGGTHPVPTVTSCGNAQTPLHEPEGKAMQLVTVLQQASSFLPRPGFWAEFRYNGHLVVLPLLKQWQRIVRQASGIAGAIAVVSLTTFSGCP